jgi:hypothetical protein
MPMIKKLRTMTLRGVVSLSNYAIRTSSEGRSVEEVNDLITMKNKAVKDLTRIADEERRVSQ